MKRAPMAIFLVLSACGSMELTAPAGSEASMGGVGNRANGSSGSELGGAAGSPSAGGGTMQPRDSGTPESNTGGSTQGGAGGANAGADANAADACATPAGADVSAETYQRPTTTLDCSFDALSLQSATLTNEADFLTTFGCPETAASGIDFNARRLRVTVIPQAGFTEPSRHHAVLQEGTIRLGFEIPFYCGGAFPPAQLGLTLLPSGTEPVEDEICRPGNCGSGGFPP